MINSPYQIKLIDTKINFFSWLKSVSTETYFSTTKICLHFHLSFKQETKKIGKMKSWTKINFFKKSRD
jgi:hypothetical protein